jgi:hypothetical protein
MSNTSASDYVRTLFAYLDDYALSISCKNYPDYGLNCEVKYQFPNNSSLRIWTDRSDVYLDICRADGHCLDLSSLLKKRAVNLEEYSELLKSEFEQVKSWIGI